MNQGVRAKESIFSFDTPPESKHYKESARGRVMYKDGGGVMLEQTLCRMDAAAERTRTCLQRVCGSIAPPAADVHRAASLPIQKRVL
jgi:hypothetical protein